MLAVLSFYLALLFRFSLSAYHRSVSRSCLRYLRKTYHRKLSGTPRLSRYSFLAFSFSSSVGAVLYWEYNNRIDMESNLSINPFLFPAALLLSPTNDISSVQLIILPVSVHSSFCIPFCVSVVSIVTILSIPLRYVKYRHHRHVSSRLCLNQ